MKSRSLIAFAFALAAGHGSLAYAQAQTTERTAAQSPAVQAPAAPASDPQTQSAAPQAKSAAAAPAADAKAAAPAAPVQTIVVQARQPSPTEQFMRDALLVAVLILLVFAGFLLVVFARAVRAGERIAVQSQWGGFGSGMGGWRMSSSLSALVGAFMVLLFAAYLAGSLLHPDSVTLPAKDKEARGGSSNEAKK